MRALSSILVMLAVLALGVQPALCACFADHATHAGQMSADMRGMSSRDMHDKTPAGMPCPHHDQISQQAPDHVGAAPPSPSFGTVLYALVVPALQRLHVRKDARMASRAYVRSPHSLVAQRTLLRI